MVVPSSGELATSSVPPATFARSRIIAIPK
jgi:hypothetical protein